MDESSDDASVQSLDYGSALKRLFPGGPVHLAKTQSSGPRNSHSGIWRRWKLPRPPLPIDSMVEFLRQRDNAPFLRTPDELKAAGVVCPFYIARRWVALAVARGRLEVEKCDFERSKGISDLVETAKSAQDLSNSLREFLTSVEGAPPRAFPAELLKQYRAKLSDEDASSNSELRRDILEHLREGLDGSREPRVLINPGYDLFSDKSDESDCQRFSEETRSAYETISLAASALTRLHDMFIGQQDRIDVRGKEPWKTAFVTELCYAWFTLTLSKPAHGGLFDDFVSAAYYSVGGSGAPGEWIIRKAITRIQKGPKRNQFDRYDDD